MSPKRPTLEDVARVAGLSRATVSLVIRNSPLVAEKTRLKVEQIMADLDYVRDIGAARLRNNSSHTVGVIVPNLVNSFFTEFLSGIEQVMAEPETPEPPPQPQPAPHRRSGPAREAPRPRRGLTDPGSRPRSRRRHPSPKRAPKSGSRADFGARFGMAEGEADGGGLRASLAAMRWTVFQVRVLISLP